MIAVANLWWQGWATGRNKDDEEMQENRARAREEEKRNKTTSVVCDFDIRLFRPTLLCAHEPDGNVGGK
jgi:hypothetical protein